MLKFVINRVIAAADKRYGGDSSYLRLIYAASPRAFRKFTTLSSLVAHREAVSIDAHAAAMLVGVLAEDCGPCVQLVVNMSREAGVIDRQIEAVLKAKTEEMTQDTALAFRFAHAVITRTGADSARETISARWGDKGVIDLTFALQFARIYPMIKAGLGLATACNRIQVGSKIIDNIQHVS
jgi:alkylhydroperoxidase family enzyme